MALGAYAQLDTFDADARYHAAVLHLQSGDVAGAHALADTILDAVTRPSPRLHGARHRRRRCRRPRRPGPGASGSSCRAIQPRRWRPGRPEYQDHEPVIEEFKKAAEGRQQ